VHDRPVERAEAGQRVAVALPGVERNELQRGDALVEPDAYPVSYRLDVTLTELAEVEDGARLHVHHGTAAVLARVVRIGGRYAQLRLTRPVVAARGDRIVLRDSTTVGGGVVLDPAPPRHAEPRRLELIERGEIGATIGAPVRAASLRRLLTGSDPVTNVVHAGEWVLSPRWLEELRVELERRLDGADPLDPGIDAPGAPWANDVVPLLGLERRGSRLYRPGAAGELGARSDEAERIAEALTGSDPVKVGDPKLARALERQGRVVRLGDGFVIAPETYESARRTLVAECEASGRITLARFRDLLGISRRHAQLLLERFDADGLTRRVGDERVLRRAASRAD
jgi:selenocysteine-specific elongation factor